MLVGNKRRGREVVAAGSPVPRSLTATPACWLISATTLLAAGTLAPSARARQPASAPDPALAPMSATPAGQPYVHRGFTYRSTTVARYNPLGLSTFLRAGYQMPLLGPQENILLQQTYVALHGILSLTPAYARGGLRVDVQPLAIFSLISAYELVGYFGSIDSLQSFATISENYSDAAQKERGRRDLHYAASGSIFTLEPNLQARVGPLTFVSTTDFVHNDMRLRDADPLYFDPFYDLLAPRRGWIISNETQLLFGPTTGFAAGVRHGIYHALYPGAVVASDPARARAITPIDFVGPLFVYTFFDHNRADRFNAPLLFACVAWWLRHPYRTGVETSRAVPYLTVGFTFRGDL